MKLLLLLSLACAIFPLSAMANQALQKDTFKTSGGDLEIYFIGHGSLMFTFGGKTIHVDPTGMFGDYDHLPKADLVLITHEHFDHFDPKTLAKITTEKTPIIATATVSKQLPGCTVMKNGDTIKLEGLTVEAVPAYNMVHMRSPGNPFHPKGVGNGYIITFGDKRVYVAGDTENTPEMKALKNIDIAFLPMNLPYTMTPEMVADAAKAFMPKILYPYHFGDTDTSKLVDLLKGVPIEVRIRDLK
jgi:L-ascorbate metabolism protein UlaG (beta-lactamase superfamily)